jgi:uncharacterized integral membrane protein
MRVVFFLLALLFLLAGILFGALNAAEVGLDFHWFSLTLPLGVALLGFALLGAMLAGLVLGLTVIWPQRRRIARLARREHAGDAVPIEPVPSAFPGAP